MCGSVSRLRNLNDRHVILSLVLTPYLARTKVRKEKNLLSGPNEVVELTEEVCR